MENNNNFNLNPEELSRMNERIKVIKEDSEKKMINIAGYSEAISKEIKAQTEDNTNLQTVLEEITGTMKVTNSKLKEFCNRINDYLDYKITTYTEKQDVSNQQIAELNNMTSNIKFD